MPSYSGSASTFNSFTGRFNLLGSFASGQFQEDTPAENSESQVIIKCHNNPAALEVFQEAKNVHASTYRESLLMELTNSIFVDLEGLSNDIMTDLPQTLQSRFLPCAVSALGNVLCARRVAHVPETRLKRNFGHVHQASYTHRTAANCSEQNFDSQLQLVFPLKALWVLSEAPERRVCALSGDD